MPRTPRPIVPGQPLHVVQRGNNRVAAFVAIQDFVHYTRVLREASEDAGCAIHAYVLMSNHVHLLVTPDSASGPSRMMQSVGRRYVRYFNDRHRRTGTLWEGRFRSTLVDSERYLLACSRYIELNPVRTGMVHRPGDYRWSSFRCNAHGEIDALITPHGVYRSLGARVADRRAGYRALFAEPLDAGSLDAIRDATTAGTVLGGARFRAKLELELERRLTRIPHGGDRRSASFSRRGHRRSTTLTP